MNTLVVTRGLPASGKTTWARHWVAGDPNRARVNRDDLRENLFGRPAPLPYELEQAVTAAQQEAVRGLLRAKRDVVVDDTHLRAKYLRAWEEIAAEEGASFTVADWFLSVDVETCVMRDIARGDAGDRAVGEKVIREMAERLKNALRSEKNAPVIEAPRRYMRNNELPSAFIFDVDGTLARHVSRSPYDYTRVIEDEPVQDVVYLARHLSYVHNLLIVSGRESSCRADTERWLIHHVGNGWENLFMRETGDSREDSIIKQEIFWRDIAPHYNVLGVFDDRNRVVRMWRSLGLLCCQVAPGAF